MKRQITKHEWREMYPESINNSGSDIHMCPHCFIEKYISTDGTISYRFDSGWYDYEPKCIAREIETPVKEAGKHEK